MLITTALSLITPYLQKTGESIVKEVGKDIWKLLKKPFEGDKDNEFLKYFNNQENKDEVIRLLLEEISKDEIFQQKLEKEINSANHKLKCLSQQVINNNGNIEKQVNIQTIHGDFNF